MTIEEQMRELAQRSKTASRALATLTTDDKNACLKAMAAALVNATAGITAANQADLQTGQAMGLSAAMLDRLKLDQQRIAAMARGLEEVAALPDPVGRILDERTRPNGLRLRKISTPIGVVVIIYESRPNVTADAAGLCLKSGNAVILRGGREALQSNREIGRIMTEAATAACGEYPGDAILVVPTADREAIPALLAQTSLVDLCMPRGGEGLIRAVAACSKVPVIKHYKGVCHVYVDANADLTMAENIVVNAKAQRPAVCNAMETLLVDDAIAPHFLPTAARRLNQWKVQFRADPRALEILKSLVPETLDVSQLQAAGEQDWQTEYNDYILNVRCVSGLQAAIDHINRHGSAHSDSIVTENAAKADAFLAQVDSATVYWNASTRFTDGGEFGMGAEIGISTDKIGARGPMGLEELTTYKWLGYGNGQIRS